MTRPFPLQTVHELMQTRADEATQQLAKLIASERDAKSKLAMLQQYRDEYAARFRDAAQQGVTQIQWRNYQDFLNRLDDAIDQQKQNVAQQERNTASGQMNWQHHRKNLKAFPLAMPRARTHAKAKATRKRRMSLPPAPRATTPANPPDRSQSLLA